MISPDPESHCSSVAGVAATLTRLRATMANWRWNGDVAVLRVSGKTKPGCFNDVPRSI